MIKKRNLGLVILFGFLTFGIYIIVLMCKIGKEVNKICDGDGKKQCHYLLAVLLGFVTFGIYTALWCYKLMNRMQDNAYRYGNSVHPPHSGSDYILWMYLGMFIGVGPLVALCHLVSDVNAFADIVGYVEPLPYTENMVERLALAENRKVAPVIPGTNNGFQPAINTPVQQAPAYNAPQSPDAAPPTAFAPGYKPMNLQGTLTCTAGMYSGIPFPVVDGESMIIGTNSDVCNIVITDDQRIVSGKHCCVSFSASGNSYTVTDFSTNGTFINGTLLNKNIPVSVSAGDVMTLGDNRNAFRFG